MRLQGVDSILWVDRKGSDDWTVRSHDSLLERTTTRLRPIAGYALPKLCFTDLEPAMRSFNWIPSRWVKRINQFDCDVVHLQWFNSEMLSIADVGKINKPIIQTLHDMWSFCGAEHYTHDTRWQDNYSKDTRPDSLRGLDIDSWTFNRKRKHWKTPRQLVAISQWMSDCISTSSLFSQWPVTVIPNPVDVECWKPLDKVFARSLFNLPLDKRIISFGAVGGTRNPRKGYQLLLEALNRLAAEIDDIHIVVFGQSKPQVELETPFPTTYVGNLGDQYSMCALNCASDVFANPAIQEAFGQTAAEAHACGLPVVAFNGTGLADVIEHERTGYLARPMNAEDLAHGIKWVLEQNTSYKEAGLSKRSEMSHQARTRAEKLFSYQIVGQQYAELYAKVSQR